jgi:hypothetical protein
MNATMSHKLRGAVIKVPDATPGILAISGRQQAFSLDGVWRSAVAPAPNQTVEVELDNAGTLVSVTVLDQQQLVQERLTALGGVAQEQGKQIAAQLQRLLSALAARMGMATLAAAVLVWIAWYLLPAAGISGGGEDIASFSFHTLLGTNLADQSSLMAPGHSRVMLRYLGFFAIVAPFAAPFIKTPWSRFLNAAPLAVTLIGWIVIHENVASGLGQLGADNPFAFKWGFYVLLVACLALASRAQGWLDATKNPAQ